MADTKISALADIVTLAAGDKVAVADASDLTVSKSATMTELKAFVAPTLLTGTNGTVAQEAAPSQTLQVLTANNADQTVLATPTTQLTASTVGVGWWLVEYFILWQSNVTTTGINFIVDHTGTAVNFQAT